MRPESLYFLFSPVTRLKGVSHAAAKSLANLLPPTTEGGQVWLRDVLFHLPVGFLDRRFTCALREAPEGVVATFVVTVDEHLPPTGNKRFSKKPYKIICSNETGEITLVFFHAREDYLKQMLPVGQKRIISGRTEKFDYQLQMTHPDIIAPVSELAQVQRQEPVYPLTAGLTSRRIGKIIEDIFAKLPALPEWITPETLAAQKWLSWKDALAAAHHPQSAEDCAPSAPARRRLAYDEMLAKQLHLALLRRNMATQPGEKISANGELAQALLKSLPFTLTRGQQQALKEIEEDMASGRRMVRLLQGDVGSGKTIVALLAMLNAAGQGSQSALMVPTELVAQQHYEVISKMLRELDVGVVLLTGSVKGKAREQALAAIASGEAKIVIGTHALFQEHVNFSNLALVIIDEQHRFGVEQRMALSRKGTSPHILHMTATPIPRSLTMTLYGDMDCSLLMEKPAGRKPVVTRAIPLSRYGEIIERLQAALARGEKAYWICPLIDEESDDSAAAKTRFAEFKARFGGKVALVHGRMKSDERDAQMQAFAHGDKLLLVATSVVEVGVDVSDATIMVIERAERFGLSQLHQLRGRVGRGDRPSSCVLLYGEVASDKWQVTSEKETNLTAYHLPLATQRLSILRETDDGFAIAEADLASRGGGDLLGTRQSGLPRFIFTDFSAHQDLLPMARDEAKKALKDDPTLESPRGEALSLLLQLFGYESAAEAVSAQNTAKTL